MATSHSNKPDSAIEEAVERFVDAVDEMAVPFRWYLFGIVGSSIGFFLLTVAVALVLDFPIYVRLPFPVLGLLAVVAALMYPQLLVEGRRKEMDTRLHLLVTHMTVLSTTNIDRMSVFRTLAREEEYRALADEMARIVQLVDAWHQSLDDACRRRAKEVPSKALSNILDRLAYTLGAGQELRDFLLSEQHVIMENYVTVYESALGNLAVMKDLYLSMILSMTFGLVFAIVLPVLTGTDPTLTVSAVIVLFGFVQLGFALAIKAVTPYDPVWYRAKSITPRSAGVVRYSVVGGMALAALLLVAVLLDLFGVVGLGLLARLPMPVVAVLPLTPLLFPGVIIRREEAAIKERDEEFPSFIRALGAAESAKQTTTTAVLKDLRKKDFGSLTTDINNLYKRLNLRIEPARAWRYFAADTQSYLIQKFSEMYLVGRQMGGEPKQLGEIISSNMNEVLQLRERRDQETVTLIGVLYGITAASTFALFIGLTIVQILSDMAVDLSANGAAGVGQLLSTASYNLPLIEFFLIVVILFNAVLSSLMIRTLDGGHKINAYLHLVILAWLGALIAVLTEAVVTAVLNV